jgi:hypothetical protein
VAPAEVAQTEAPQPAKEMPQTASQLPLLGLIGALALVTGVVLFVAGWRTH